MLRLATVREDLNDDHAATATRARCWQHTRLIGLGGSVRLRLRHVRRHGEQFAGPRNVGAAIAIGEQPVVTDAMQAVGQHVDQEPPDELARGQGHDLVPARPFDPVILPLKRDALLVGGDEPAVGDCDAMGVACQIGEHGLRSSEGLLGIDDPLAFAQRGEKGGEGGLVCKPGAIALELQAVRGMRGAEHLKKQPPEQARERPHGQEKARPARDPS